MIINGVDVTDMVNASAMNTRVDKIKAEDERLQKIALAGVSNYAGTQVAEWMLENGYTLPDKPVYDRVVTLEDLLSAIATQAAERAVTPSRVPE